MSYLPRILLCGEEISAEVLRKIFDGAADYIVFDNRSEFVVRHNDLCSLKILERFIPRETLFRQARHSFYSAQNFLNLSKIVREKIFSRLLDVDGNWHLLKKRAPKSFCVYVVTHKDAKLDTLPEGYKLIHAGHAQAKENFSRLFDDSGEISAK